MDACVDNALNDFMANSGKALASALAPYLYGPFGLDVAARVLRAALAHYAELRAPELLEFCHDILDELGLSPDVSMRIDASRRFTPAKHKTFQDRLNRLKLTEEAYGFTVS